MPQVSKKFAETHDITSPTSPYYGYTVSPSGDPGTPEQQQAFKAIDSASSAGLSLPDMPTSSTPEKSNVPSFDSLLTASNVAVNEEDLRKQVQSEFEPARKSLEERFNRRIGEAKQASAQETRALGGALGTGRRFSTSATAFINFTNTENAKKVAELEVQMEDALTNMDFQMAKVIAERIKTEKEDQQQNFENIFKIITAAQTMEEAEAKKNEPILKSQKEAEILGYIDSGETNISKILENVRAKYPDTTIEDINGVFSAIRTAGEKDKIQSLVVKLAEYGVSEDILEKVRNAKSYDEAISYAGIHIQDPVAKQQLLNLKIDEDIKNLTADKLQKENDLIGMPTEAERKATLAALKTEEGQKEAFENKKILINSILTSSGMSARVGTNIMSRSGTGKLGTALGTAGAGAATGAFFGPIGAVVGGAIGLATGLALGAPSDISGSGQGFSGAVHNLTAGLTLDELVKAKAQGATFGTLTEGEWQMLGRTATQLNDWEIKDEEGNGTGYWNVDEGRFKEEVNRLQSLIVKANGGISTSEKSELSSLYSPLNNINNVSSINFY